MVAPQATDGLKLLSSGAGLIPVVGSELSILIDIALQFCENAEKAKEDKEKIKELSDHAAKLLEDIIRELQATTNQDFLKERIGDVVNLRSILENILSLTKKKKKTKSFLNKKANIGEVDELRQRLDSITARFGIKSHLKALNTIQEIRRELKQMSDAAPPSIRPVHSEGARGLLLELKPVYEAKYNYGPARPSCLENTREQVIRQIMDWIHNDNAEPLKVLTGKAGTGKTTIAQTVCERLGSANPSSLGASFFFSRIFASRRDPLSVVRTLAFQLSRCSQHLKSLITSAIDARPEIVACSLQEQVQVLIADPLANATDLVSPIIFVLDALDECDVGGEGLIHFLFQISQQLLPKVKLKTLITSGFEPRIQERFDLVAHSSYSLDEIADNVVADEVRTYFVHHFRRIVDKNPGFDLETWPTEEDLSRLVLCAGRSFIFAATVIEYVDVIGSPHVRLQELLASLPTIRAEDGDTTQLDALYSHILRSSTVLQSGAISEREGATYVKRVAGTIALLQDPLTEEGLIQLLAHDNFETRSALYGLGPVLVLPGDSSPQSTAVVHVSHVKFANFVTSAARCDEERFFVDIRAHRTYLAQRCLELMNTYLHPDMCDIGDPSLSNSDILDLETRIHRFIRPEVAYACKYWLDNLLQSDGNMISLQRPLGVFCEKNLLAWIEVCSLLGVLPLAMDGLCRMHSWFLSVNGLEDEYTLLRDAERLLLEFYDPIKASSLIVHYGVLPFLPECMLLQSHTESLGSAPKRLALREERWNAALEILENQNFPVVFSTDGRLAWYSTDQLVYIRNTWLTKESMTIPAFTGGSASFAFSRDGCRIYSASGRSIRIWDPSFGIKLGELENITPISSLAISPDGSRLACGSEDGYVYIREARTGVEKMVLSGHTGPVTLVHYSTDGTLLVSGSVDRTVRTWNTQTGDPTSTFEYAHDVKFIVPTSDNQSIFASEGDHTVRRWNISTGAQLAVFSGHTDDIMALALSEDDLRLVSGGVDSTIRVWDASSGACLAVLAGHRGPVKSIAVLLGSARMCSWSEDQTIRVWDLGDTSRKSRPKTILPPASPAPSSQGSAKSSPKQRPGLGSRLRKKFSGASGSSVNLLSVSQSVLDIPAAAAVVEEPIIMVSEYTNKRAVSCALSPDESLLAISDDDGLVRICDTAQEGNPMKLRKPSPNAPIARMLFSHDNLWLVVVSADDVSRIWDLASGECRAIFERLCVAAVFWDKSGLVATRDGDLLHAVTIRSAETKQRVCTLEGHTAPVVAAAAVVLSPNNSRLFSRAQDGEARVWDLETGTCIAVVAGVAGGGPFLFTREETRVVRPSLAGFERVWVEDGCEAEDDGDDEPRVRAEDAGALFFLSDDGWLCGPVALGGSGGGPFRRLVWLPPRARGHTFVVDGEMMTTVSAAGRVTRVDMGAYMAMLAEMSSRYG